MIREVDDMPWELAMTAEQAALFLQNSAEYLAYTHTFYEVRSPSGALIAAGGVALWAFTRPPELWLRIGKAYLVNLRESLRLCREAADLPLSRYPLLVADVRNSSHIETHFALHMGWVPTGQLSARPNAQDFTQFKVL